MILESLLDYERELTKYNLEVRKVEFKESQIREELKRKGITKVQKEVLELEFIRVKMDLKNVREISGEIERRYLEKIQEFKKYYKELPLRNRLELKKIENLRGKNNPELEYHIDKCLLELSKGLLDSTDFDVTFPKYKCGHMDMIIYDIDSDDELDVIEHEEKFICRTCRVWK